MAKKFKDLLAATYEARAREKFFLKTGRNFYKLNLTEQRKLVEAEIERVSERSVPCFPRRDSNA